MDFIIPIIFFMIALGLMLAALHFAKYKKRPSGCCGAHAVCAHHKKDETSNEENNCTQH